MDVIGALFEGGPARFLNIAEKSGFRSAHHYAGKCHICSDIRKFFFDKGLFAAIIGPVQCYSEGKGIPRRRLGNTALSLVVKMELRDG
jgi:hypothetical protein